MWSCARRTKMAVLFGPPCVYKYMGPRTSEARARFLALRTAYDSAFQEFSRQVFSLQSSLQHATLDRTAISEAGRRVEQAQSIYRDSRDSLARFLLSHDKKESQLRAEVERLAHQLWERAGRPVGRADEHWYRAEHLLQHTP
jgi:hypothetical protein